VIQLRIGRREPVEALQFSPDGQALVAASMVGLHVWRQPTSGSKQRADVLPIGGDTTQIGFLGDRSELIADPRELIHVDLGTGNSTRIPLWRDVGCCFGILPQSRKLIVGQDGRGESTAKLQCRAVAERSLGDTIWSVDLPRGLTWRNHPRFVGDGSRFILVEIFYDPEAQRGTYFLVSRRTDTGQATGELEIGTERILQLTSSPDGVLVAGYRNTRLLVWAVAPTPKQVAELRTGNKKEFTSLAFHPSSRFFAATSNDQTVKLYDTTSWELAKTHTWDIGRMRSIAFSPDGTLAAAGSDTGKVVVWDVDV
jgi:WD40 repeat protein